MSTINATNVQATNVQDSSGANGSTPLQISSGRAKIWATFSGTGTPAVTAQGGSSTSGISSITDNTTGDYTFNFSPALTDVNWCGLTLGGGGSSYSQRGYEDGTARTTSAWRTYWTNEAGSPTDTPNNNIAIFGN